MKTLTPTNLIAVEVPKDAKWIQVAANHKNTVNFLIYRMNGKKHEIEIPLGLVLLGEVTDTETNIFKGDFIECEESIDIPEYKYGGELHPKEMFWDYEEKSFSLESSENSFRSLLQSNELFFENPMGKAEGCCSGRDCGCMGQPINFSCKEEFEEWQSYESKLIKGKLIILKKK